MRGGGVAVVAAALCLLALPRVPAAAAQEVLRGQVRIDLEPVYARYLEDSAPLDTETARRRALEEASYAFAGMIYGWSFDYDIGERARDYTERLDLHPRGEIPFGDPRLRATDGEVRDMRLYLWVEYGPDEVQKRRLAAWNMGTARNVQGRGTGSLVEPPGEGSWFAGKAGALEDAARAAIRAYLRSTERNRPKECRGLIALAAFPTYQIVSGRWTATARFRLEITELRPFPAY